MATAKKAAERPGLVLVVEDSHVQAKIICRHLAGLSTFDAVAAGSMAEAAAVAQREGDRLLAAVVNMNLPDAPDGEAVDMLMASGVPTIVLTAIFKEDVREALLAKRVTDYVVKENMAALDDLVAIVNRLYRNMGVTALVVDDEAVARAMMRKMLETQRYNVLEAAGGQEALDLVRSRPDIRLVVTDYHMPGMDGFELTRELRREKKRSQLAILGVSGVDDRALPARFLKLGADDFLLKPFTAEEFAQRANHAVELIEMIAELNDCRQKLA
ncbi:MAG: response regulator [Thermodesulfobacteriota bacterium]